MQHMTEYRFVQITAEMTLSNTEVNSFQLRWSEMTSKIFVICNSLNYLAQRYSHTSPPHYVDERNSSFSPFSPSSVFKLVVPFSPFPAHFQLLSILASVSLPPSISIITSNAALLHKFVGSSITDFAKQRNLVPGEAITLHAEIGGTVSVAGKVELALFAHSKPSVLRNILHNHTLPSTSRCRCMEYLHHISFCHYYVCIPFHSNDDVTNQLDNMFWNGSTPGKRVDSFKYRRGWPNRLLLPLPLSMMWWKLRRRMQGRKFRKFRSVFSTLATPSERLFFVALTESPTW